MSAYDIRPVMQGGQIVGLTIAPDQETFRDRLIDLLNDLAPDELLELQDSARRATGNRGVLPDTDPAEAEAYCDENRGYVDQALKSQYPDADNVPVPVVHLSGTQDLNGFLVDLVNVFYGRTDSTVDVEMVQA